MDALVQFGVTGAIGPVRCDALLGEVAAELGAPEDLGWVSKRRRWPHRFGYGDLELCVCRCRRVLSFEVQTWRGVIDLPPLGRDAGSELVRHSGRISSAELTAALSVAGCAVVEETASVPGQMTLRALGGRVAFVFSMDHQHGAVLECAGAYYGTGHACPPIVPGTPEDGFGLGEITGP